MAAIDRHIAANGVLVKRLVQGKGARQLTRVNTFRAMPLRLAPGLHQTQAFLLFDHSNWTVNPFTFFVFQAQMSPISPLWSSYQPRPGTASVIASHSSCELVEVRASKACRDPRQPAQPA